MPAIIDIARKAGQKLTQGLVATFGPRSQAALEGYAKLFAAGEPVDIDAIATALEGRDSDAFPKAVEGLQARHRAVESLKECAIDAKQLAALQADHRAARAAFENLPIMRMIAEMNEAKAAGEKLHGEVQALSFNIAQRKNQAMHLLKTTARKNIHFDLQQLQGEINTFADKLKKVNLSDSEAKAFAAARVQVATLPERIAALKKSKSPDAAAECVAASAQLLSAQSAIREFGNRIAAAEEIGREIAKLEAKKVAIGNSFLDPENMEFVFPPRAVS